MTATRRMETNTQEELDAGTAFYEKYRHALCRDAKTGRGGMLVDVRGRQASLRGVNGREFDCAVRDLILLSPPPPTTGKRVRYVGEQTWSSKPDGELTELWGLSRGGALATVQPPARAAWFALLSDLEWLDCPLPIGPVAEWTDPPLLLIGEER